MCGLWCDDDEKEELIHNMMEIKEKNTKQRGERRRVEDNVNKMVRKHEKGGERSSQKSGGRFSRLKVTPQRASDKVCVSHPHHQTRVALGSQLIIAFKNFLFCHK